MEAFENRLKKMYKHNGKWARRQGIECFRVYDKDIPGFPFSVDIYGESVYVSLYQGKNTLQGDTPFARWIENCLQTISKALHKDRRLVFMKKRQQQKGLQQYEKITEDSFTFTVKEDGLSFLVNMTDYLDTGLFLDHRITRRMVREQSVNKRVLNLFAYTGSFSVYAAAGGASKVFTVDLSNTYLQWAKQNMEMNGFNGEQYIYIQDDVKQFLWSDVNQSFDIIILDPPTFSNSKRMKDILDIQKDYADLINQCLTLCDEGGRLFFSTNYRGFNLDKTAIASKSIKEISHITVPQDFRDKSIHRCFIIDKE